jgi:diadenosine tetraphosphatase ApaH/serine/threonine PP2A family protein phosphatase
MRLALFGGVYSNPRALAAVLADADARGADHAWCLGDLGGFGPDPEGAAALLRGRGVPMLQGNYDHSLAHGLADCACGYTDPRDEHFAQVSYDFTDARTGAATREWLRALPPQARLEAGGRRVLLCHGSPRRVNEFLWDSRCSDAFLEWLLREFEADVIACTHTGLHWHRALPAGDVVNVGAIGRPAHDGRPGAWWAELELGGGPPRVAFRHVRYDHEALAREIEDAGLPGEFAETIRTGWWTTCLENVPARERAAAAQSISATRRVEDSAPEVSRSR